MIGFSAIGFGMGLYPNIFYRMIPHQMSGSDLMVSNIIYRGTLILLLLVSGILIAARRMYGSTHEIQIDHVFTNSIKHIFIITIITIGILTLAEACPIVDIKTSWKIYQIFMSPIEIFAPACMFITIDSLMYVLFKVL